MNPAKLIPLNPPEQNAHDQYLQNIVNEKERPRRQFVAKLDALQVKVEALKAALAAKR